MAALKADHSALPAAKPAGHPPDSEPRYVTALAARLAAERDRLDADGGKPTADGTPLRHSDAGKCARALSLKLAGVEPAPIDVAGLHVMHIGSLVHEQWQDALREALEPQAHVDVEVTCRIPDIDHVASGHADAVVYDDPAAGPNGEPGGHTTCIELKTQGGFGYKMAVGERGAPQGPRHSAVLQGALNAAAVDADELVIAVLTTEAISKPAAARKGIDDTARFAAEWSYSPDVFGPLAEREAARLAHIVELHADGWLAPTAIPDPEIPWDALVVDPATGRWEVRQPEPDGTVAVTATGETWMCGYCPFQQACAALDTPEAAPVGALVDVLLPVAEVSS